MVRGESAREYEAFYQGGLWVVAAWEMLISLALCKGISPNKYRTYFIVKYSVDK